MSVNIYLIRHGKTLGAAALNGRTDVAVAKKTQQEICQKLLEQYEFTQVVSSPLRRCWELGKLLHQTKPSLSLQSVAAFQELDFGRYDGVPYDELGENWRDLEAFWQAPEKVTLPGAEPLSLGFARVQLAWQQLVSGCQTDTALIAHGGTIRFILADVLGVNWANPKWYSTLEIANQSVTHIEINRYQGETFFKVKTIGARL